MTDLIADIALLSGLTRQAVIVFCSNNGISYAQLKAWYIARLRMPTVAECQTIKNQ